MIVYYDLLMIDDESLLFVKHSERFQRLKDLIAVVPGRSALVKRVIIDCDRPSATSDLRRAFAKCITARGEGLVLKADDPYFDWSPSRRPYACCAIKLKKEYIGHFGDIGDFAVVGARYDAAKARAYTIPKVKWTHFYVGCLGNKDEVRRFGKRPQFVVTNVVELNATQLDVFTTSINPEAVPAESNTTISLRIEPGIDNGKRPSVIFPTPPVVDLRCFSFEKEGNTGLWSPRFPSVTKIHSDRTYHDALSFDELQDMAIKEKELPPPEDSQELLGWIAALEQSEPTATVGETSQSSVSTGAAPMTPSHKSSQSCQSPVSPGPRLRGPREIDSPTLRRSTSTQTGQLTPPRSSAIQVPESATPNVLLDMNEAAQNRKRPHEALGCDNMHERAKMQRCSSDHISTTRPSQSNSMNLTATGLVGASASPSRRNSHAGLRIPRLSASRSMPRVDMEGEDSRVRDAARLSVPASQSFHGVLVPVFASSAPSSGSSVLPSKHNNISFNQVSATTAETTAIRNCRYLGDSCKLSTYSIMLSPCIANFPWVTENLLVSHGVTEFIRDPKAWLRDGQASGATAAVPSTSDISANSTAESAGHPSSLNKKRRRCKKLVLVDARRREATEAFLASIQAAQLKRRNGEREYVPVFDWRVLESVMEEERRCCLGKEKPGGRFEISIGQSIWKQYWIGLT
jgi:DNA ligase-4